MPSKILSAALKGLEAEIITVEADSGGGDFGNIAIVGLPDTAVSEAKERVKSVLRNCGLPYPRRKITVNLAPADFKKHGTGYDLPIAISILALKNNFTHNFTRSLIVGELSLSGETRPLNGLLSIVLSAAKYKLENIFLPAANAAEASLIKSLTIFPVNNLRELTDHLLDRKHISAWSASFKKIRSPKNNFDLAFIKGQEKAKRALEIAAAGGHNLLLLGPPGSGKTMLAKSLPSILPGLSPSEKLEVIRIYSVAGKLKNQEILSNQRPFRSPHHSTSLASLIGGGLWPKPGEISLAHRGVLFLDELGKFSKIILENLRQPLEDKTISLSRSTGILKFPANFILLAATNPCACGYYGDGEQVCRCTERERYNYKRRLSGPILDQIDLHVQISRVNFISLIKDEKNSLSDKIKKRVIKARGLQIRRYQKNINFTNADLDNQLIKKYCSLNSACLDIMASAVDKLQLSARSYFKIIKIARTIADLAGEKNIQAEHLAEALQYRPRNQ